MYNVFELYYIYIYTEVSVKLRIVGLVKHDDLRLFNGAM